MINYDNIILQWKNSVVQYCKRRNIPNMELRNLCAGDVYDYALYVVYKQARDATAAYRKTPNSSLYARNMISAIKKWYIATTDSKLDKISMKIMSNDMFARFICRTK